MLWPKYIAFFDLPTGKEFFCCFLRRHPSHSQSRILIIGNLLPYSFTLTTSTHENWDDQTENAKANCYVLLLPSN